MEHNTQNKLKLLNSLFGSTGEFLKDQEDNQLLTPQHLQFKASSILSRINNGPKSEEDFRRTCLLYKNQKSTPQLKTTYQDYINAYHKATSLYKLCQDNQLTVLKVFNTEKETEKNYILKVPELLDYYTCITPLPNGELFCYGNFKNSGITLIIDNDYKIRMLRPSVPCCKSSAIYYNTSVYCFGGMDKDYTPLRLSSRFDINENRWVNLTPMPIYGFWCHSLVFNGNILISEYYSRNIFIYSIDIGSFSTIPYEFGEDSRKLLINAERLYLIECVVDDDNGLIYESEAGDEYVWKQIGRSIIGFSIQAYCSYNKGMIHISLSDRDKGYYKFDLSSKKVLRLQKNSNWLRRLIKMHSFK